MAEQRVAVTRTYPQRAVRAVDALVRGERERLPALGARLGRAAQVALQRERQAIAQRSSRVRLADPREVLARGFAIVRDRSGGFATTATDARGASHLAIEFQDGSVHAQVVDDPTTKDDA
jgi:exodeoxyribonuclease VII large subunit